MRFCKLIVAIVLLLFQWQSASADDPITAFMSPVASYQNPQNLNTEVLVNGGMSSRTLSYQNPQNLSNEVLLKGGVSSPILSYQDIERLSDEILSAGGIASGYVSYEYQQNVSAEIFSNGGISSPFASYQFQNNLVSEIYAGGGVLTRFTSYQYYEWPGEDVLKLLNSPAVNYYYAQILLLTLTDRTPTMSETTPSWIYIPPPPSQLLAYHGGIFTPNLVSIDPNQMTIVLTHGWNSDPNSWPLDMAKLIHDQLSGPEPNIVAWDWSNAATSAKYEPGVAAEQTGDQGRALGAKLQQVLGPNYAKPIHFIGHSLGTLVNGSAANYLHGDQWANEDFSPTPWPGANTHITLFDEAEAATGQIGIFNLAETLLGWNGNPLAPKPSYYHPLPKQFIWADNYVSAFGLLHPEAANIILTNGLPVNAINVTALRIGLEDFHGYPMDWYEETIKTDASNLGFLWSFERGGWFSQAPTAGSVYVQAYNNSEWDLKAESWSYGTNLLDKRFQEYRNSLAFALTGKGPDSVAVNGFGFGDYVSIISPVTKIVFDEIFLNLLTKPANDSSLITKVRPFGLTSNDGSNGINIPAYAWIPLEIPSNAVYMSFNYKIQGDWDSDSLAASLNGTNILLLAGNAIETNVLFSSDLIDVSAYAGRTNELFIGIIGGTSTNAELTLQNLGFTGLAAPFLQGKILGNKMIVAWPLSTDSYVLEETEDLSTTNSWTTVTNIADVENFQNTASIEISKRNQFYRLVKH